MNISIDISDAKHLELINQLRGGKSPADFARDCFEGGLQMAAFQYRQLKEAEATGHILRFSEARPEFKSLDVIAITNALKDKDSNNPIKQEVSRLVQEASVQLKSFAEKNGNKLPKILRVDARSSIEKIAFEITSQAIKASRRPQDRERSTAI